MKKKLYNINPKNRWRLILILSIVWMLILLSSLLENKNLKSINNNFSSLYKDRLIPAAETYFIAESLHEKRLILEKLNNKEAFNNELFKKELIQKNAQIDSLITSYEQTYFVNEESRSFHLFKKNLQKYLASEQRIIYYVEHNNLAQARIHLRSTNFPILSSLKEDLHALASIQAKVGKQLIENSKTNFTSNTLLYYLRFGLTILIGFFILVLVRTSPMLTPKEIKTKPNLTVVRNLKK